jgi:hypothetical protein
MARLLLLLLTLLFSLSGPAMGEYSDFGSLGNAAKNTPNDVVSSISQRAALRQAKRDAGIPTSQTHITHKPNQSTTKTPGGPLDSRDATIYKFEGGKEVQLHPTGHKFKDGSVYDKPHFNNHNNGASSTRNHYEWDN